MDKNKNNDVMLDEVYEKKMEKNILTAMAKTLLRTEAISRDVCDKIMVDINRL